MKSFRKRVSEFWGPQSLISWFFVALMHLLLHQFWPTKHYWIYSKFSCTPDQRKCPNGRKWGLKKVFYIVTRNCLGKNFLKFTYRQFDLLTLLVIHFKYSPTFNLPSENVTRCCWFGVWISWLLLNIKIDWFGFLILLEKWFLKLA